MKIKNNIEKAFSLYEKCETNAGQQLLKSAHSANPVEFDLTLFKKCWSESFNIDEFTTSDGRKKTIKLIIEDYLQLANIVSYANRWVSGWLSVHGYHDEAGILKAGLLDLNDPNSVYSMARHYHKIGDFISCGVMRNILKNVDHELSLSFDSYYPMDDHNQHNCSN